MSGPQTMREALIAELIGDVDALMTRAESLRATLPEAADKAATRVASAGETAAQQIAIKAERVRADLARDMETLLKGVQRVAGEAQAASMVVDRSARRFALLALLTGLAGGVGGGILAGLFAARYLLGS